jgi:hypothetical protein
VVGQQLNSTFTACATAKAAFLGFQMVMLEGPG